MIMRIFHMVPLLIAPLIIYIFLAFGAGGAVDENGAPPLAHLLGSSILELGMASGVKWILSVGDILLLFSVLVLFVEIIKSANSGTATLVNHGLSMGVFVVCFIAFLLLKNFATSTFFFLTMLALIDVMAGFIISISTARRDFGVTGGGGFGGL